MLSFCLGRDPPEVDPIAPLVNQDTGLMSLQIGISDFQCFHLVDHITLNVKVQIIGRIRKVSVPHHDSVLKGIGDV